MGRPLVQIGSHGCVEGILFDVLPDWCGRASSHVTNLSTCEPFPSLCVFSRTRTTRSWKRFSAVAWRWGIFVILGPTFRCILDVSRSADMMIRSKSRRRGNMEMGQRWRQLCRRPLKRRRRKGGCSRFSTWRPGRDIRT